MKKEYPDAEYLIALAMRAGEMMLRDFSPYVPPQFTWKPDNTPVTATDLEINGMVLECFKRDFPHIRFNGEEASTPVNGAEYTAFCDPLDGTIRFVAGMADYSFVIAIVRGGVPLIAVIHEPQLARTWCAEAGKGCFLNGMRATVSSHKTVHQSLISLVYWREAKYNIHAVCEKVMVAGAKWMNPVSVALYGGLIASGFIHGVITPTSHSLETAAMHLIVEEAGGRATDIFGNKLVYDPDGAIQGHIISNGHIHEELVEFVRQAQLH